MVGHLKQGYEEHQGALNQPRDLQMSCIFILKYFRDVCIGTLSSSCSLFGLIVSSTRVSFELC